MDTAFGRFDPRDAHVISLERENDEMSREITEAHRSIREMEAQIAKVWQIVPDLRKIWNDEHSATDEVIDTVEEMIEQALR